MSVQAMTRVMEFSEMTGTTRMVLLVIANHETEDRGAFPSIERLAHECRAGIRTVQEAIRKAEKAGELRVSYRQGPHGTNLYRTLSGVGTTATLPGTKPTRIRTPQNPHPAESGQHLAPERKELRVRGSSTASTSEVLTLAPSFDEAWKAYPAEGRRAKPTARRRWDVAISKAPPDVILAGIVAYANDPNRDPGHTKWMQGWLSEERWNDPPLPSANGSRRPRDAAYAQALRELGGAP